MLEHSAAMDAQHGLTGALAWVTSVVVVGLLVAGYLVMAHMRSVKVDRPWSGLRTASWVTGACLVGIAIAPPVAHFASVDARGHMVQHLLLGMYAPLALVLGAPVKALLGALPNGGRRVAARVLRARALHVLGKPVVGALLSTGALFALYLSPLYAQAMSRPWLHQLLNLHFLLAGYLFAWSIAGPDPAPTRPGIRTRVTVLLLAVGAHAYLAKLLYAHAGRLPLAEMNSVTEIRQAAVLMYYAGDLAELLVAIALFTSWYRRRTPRPARRTPYARTSRYPCGEVSSSSAGLPPQNTVLNPASVSRCSMPAGECQ